MKRASATRAGVCHRWWRRGERAPGTRQIGYQWAYIFSAVRPDTGDDVTLVMPSVNAKVKLPAMSVTVVLEACFSGASQAGAVISNASPVFLKAKAPSIPPKVTVIAAGAPNQMASWEEDKSNGLFTKYFLKGMSGEADAGSYGNGDGRVGWEELERYFKDTLTYYARRYYGRDQTPSIVVGSGG